jgi:flagella basal body P-ring formation protein FlgA
MKNSRQIFLSILLFIASYCASAKQLTGSDSSALSAAELQPDAASQMTHTDTQPADDLQTQLKRFLDEQQKALAEKGFRSEVVIGNIDPRFNEKHCTQAIQFSLNRSPLSQANLTTMASCADEQPWKLYITTTIHVFGEVVYAATTLPRAHTIQERDLQIKEEIINKHFYAGFSQKNDVVGMITKRSIRQGSSIQANLLQAPKLVKRGDDVVIMASTQGILIKMRGTAMEDGELGEQITVKNNQSARIIKARVSESGLVSVTL